MNANFGDIGTITINFRDRRNDTLIYDNVVGYQIVGGAVSISRATGENEIIPLDLISNVSFKLNEQRE